MQSYLSNRSQAIDINGTSSDKLKLDYGFPQGSKIGPFGFKLYTKPLAAIAAKHGVYLHSYADDTQLYVPFDPKNSKIAMLRMEACIAEIKSCVTSICIVLYYIPEGFKCLFLRLQMLASCVLTFVAFVILHTIYCAVYC